MYREDTVYGVDGLVRGRGFPLFLQWIVNQSRCFPDARNNSLMEMEMVIPSMPFLLMNLIKLSSIVYA